VWIGFTFAYAFIPNTKVKLRAALVGGIVAGTLWQSAQWGYIRWQIGFTKYNAIYGSFAQLPLFLIWLYISWILVLLGAEICYAFQNLGSAVRRGMVENLSPRARQRVALMVLGSITARFLDGFGPRPVREVARALRLPEDAVQDALALLALAGVTVALKEDDEEEPSFTLAVAPDKILLSEVAAAVLTCGESQGCGELFAQTDRADAVLDGFAQAAAQSPANMTLAEFAQDMRVGAGSRSSDAATGRDVAEGVGAN
jgi:membrane protein